LLIGLATRQVLHALSNRLSTVGGSLDLADRLLAEEDMVQAREWVDAARQIEREMRALTAWLVDFARAPDPAPLPYCSVNAVVEENVPTLRTLSAAHITVSLCPDLVMPAAIEDRLLRHVLFGLIVTPTPVAEARSVAIRTRSAPQGAVVEVQDSAATEVSLAFSRALLARAGGQMEVGRGKVTSARFRVPYVGVALARAVGG
jgi:C4-dicarboxylate-specific signal transduction histidine kinase